MQGVALYWKPKADCVSEWIRKNIVSLKAEQMDSKKQMPEDNCPDKLKPIKNEDDVPVSSCSILQEAAASSSREQAGHIHPIKVKFGPKSVESEISCEQPSTVLQVIKSKLAEKFKNVKKTEENIIIKLGETDADFIIATHFPCTLVDKEKCLVITTSPNTVEESKVKENTVHPKEKYSVFYILKELGENTTTKKKEVFRCTTIKSNLCVYAEKGKTVEEALRLDGRFNDDLKNFYLSDNKKKCNIECTEKVDILHGREFKICLPKAQNKKENDSKQKEAQGKVPKHQTNAKMQKQEERAPPSNDSQTIAVLEYAKEKGCSLMTAREQSKKEIDLNEINKLLLQQYPKLKELMESRFLKELSEVNFGKMQSSINEARNVEQLLNLSTSICLLEIQEINVEHPCIPIIGTGFVLFDNIVLTNAHLFKRWLESENKDWNKYVKITAKFGNNNNPERTFPARGIVGHKDLDYVVLELELDPTDPYEMPPGLLTRFGQVPKPGDDGGACIIGYQEGVKKLDFTSVIWEKDRKLAVNQNLVGYGEDAVIATLKEMQAHPYANIRVTYNSFMYHGSSGSPVFNANQEVFGLHTGGISFNKPIPGHSVVEYAFPLLYIFKDLLSQLQKFGHTDLLNRVLTVAQQNLYLKPITEIKIGLTEENKEENHRQWK